MMSLETGPGEFYSAWRRPGLICGAELLRFHRHKIKTLSGFVKGSHFIPQRDNLAAERFLRRIGDEELCRYAEDATSKIRAAFSYGAEEFELGFDSSGALFESELCLYRCGVGFDSGDLSVACFTEHFIPARQWTRTEWVELYEAMGAFECLSLVMAEPMDLREFAARVEAGPLGSAGYPEIAYPGSFEEVELIFPDGSSRYRFTGDKVEIYFGFSDDPVEAPWAVLSGVLIG